MENRLKISNTAYPDGTVVKYMHGMTPPEVKNLGYIMKQAVFNALTNEDITFPLLLEKHLPKDKPLSKAG